MHVPHNQTLLYSIIIIQYNSHVLIIPTSVHAFETMHV